MALLLQCARAISNVALEVDVEVEVEVEVEEEEEEEVEVEYTLAAGRRGHPSHMHNSEPNLVQMCCRQRLPM